MRRISREIVNRANRVIFPVRLYCLNEYVLLLKTFLKPFKLSVYGQYDLHEFSNIFFGKNESIEVSLLNIRNEIDVFFFTSFVFTDLSNLFDNIKTIGKSEEEKRRIKYYNMISLVSSNLEIT